MYSRRTNEEEDRAEKAEQLKRSKAGLTGALKRLRGQIWPLFTHSQLTGTIDVAEFQPCFCCTHWAA